MDMDLVCYLFQLSMVLKWLCCLVLRKNYFWKLFRILRWVNLNHMCSSHCRFINKLFPHVCSHLVLMLQISIIYVVPPLMVFLGKHPIVDKYDLSHVKTIVCGAAPLSKDVQEAVSKRLGVKDIRQGYGMTETTILATYSAPNSGKMGSSGRVIGDLCAKVCCKLIEKKSD